jgi:cephalosporin hydroxylase
MAAAREVFEKLVRPRHPNIQLIERPSPAAAEMFEDGELDLVYLDASHLYEAVLADIDAWWPKVAAGGVLAGHDFTALFPAVQRAVTERFPQYAYHSGGHWSVRKGDQPTS